MGRVWPRHGHRGRPLNSVVRTQMSTSAGVAEINRYLTARRAVRIVVVIGYFGFIALAVFGWLHENEPFAQSNGFFALVVAPGLVALLAGEYLRRSKCPRCGERFAARVGDKRWNNFAAKCENCGLRIDGANASEF